MRRVDLTERVVDAKGWKNTLAADPTHYGTVLDEPALLYVNDEPAGLYMHPPASELASIRASVQRIEYSETYRTGGLKTRSRVVGYQPRVTVRRDYCTTAALAAEAPVEHGHVCAGASIATKYFREHLPDAYEAHSAIVKSNVAPEWTLPDSAYTSGIVNHNNPLRYHCDSGNFPGTWNAMLAFKQDMEGGYLAIPELDVALYIRDGTLSIFNAQRYLHGVTAFRKLSPRAYRYTIVYYALQGMCKCKSAAEELARIRTVKTARETKRAQVSE